jgi:hypothetical protein
MNWNRYLAIVILVAALALPTAAQAGRMRGRGGPGYRGQRGVRHGGVALAWDKAKEVTFRGTVVEAPVAGRGQALGSPMTVRAETGAVRTVLLGPPWFLTELGLKPAPGDTVEVIGMPIQERGQEAVVAREVIWGGATYPLRTADGAPLGLGGSSAAWQRYSEVWDSGEKRTVVGQIESVEEIWPGGEETGAGVMLRLRTPQSKQVQVHLGPAWFIHDELPNLKQGEQVTVSGAEVKWQKQDVLIASVVERGGKKVRLRSDEGVPAWAGGWRNWGGWGPGSRYGRLYNPSAIETITGQVVRVGRITPTELSGQGLGIAVRSREVHLAPAWYMRQLRLTPTAGDEVSVTGSVVTVQGKQVMLASVITWHDERIELRRSDGTPLWIGRPALPR